MTWERPDFMEIGMNAEIGGYQSDFGGGSEPAGPRGPVVTSGAGTAAEAAPARADAPDAVRVA